MLVAEEQHHPEKPPRAEHYPFYVRTDEQRSRWDLALAVAREMFGGDGEEAVMYSTRAIYNGDIPT